MSLVPRAREVLELLSLQSHPEGGFYAETFRDDSVLLPKSILPPHYKVERPVSTAIYFLLPTGNVSHLHRIPCAETWHFYMGEPLTVFELSDEGEIKMTVLGLDLGSGQRPQYTVPPNVWFGSFPTKDVESFSPNGDSLVLAQEREPEFHYSLVGCVCAPGFQFDDFKLATTSEIIPLAPHAAPFIRYLTRD